MKSINYVAYYRVSSGKQTEKGKKPVNEEDKTGLGLKAQKQTVQTFVENNGGILLKEFTEVQSASNVKDKISTGSNISLNKLLRKRPVLLEAIQYAKDNNAILVVKEVARLTRFRLLGEYIMNTGIKFVCADYPQDSPLILSIKIALYQEEAEQVSKRTKAALQQRIKTKGNLTIPAILTRPFRPC